MTCKRMLFGLVLCIAFCGQVQAATTLAYIEANHTPRFWNIVRAQAPTTEKARIWLKENGQILDENI